MVVLVDDEKEVERKRMGGESGIGMGQGMGGKWRQAPIVDENIGSRHGKENPRHRRLKTQERESDSQSSWPLEEDSQSLHGSVRSYTLANGHQEERQPRLRNGPEREHPTQQRAPREQSRMAIRSGRGSNSSQEHLMKAYPSRERLINQQSIASMGGNKGASKSGSRVQSRSGSPGGSYAF